MNTAHLPHLAMILVYYCLRNKYRKKYIEETNWARICRTFKEPRNRFPAWRAGPTTLHVVPARQATWAGWIDFSESIPGLHKRLQTRALFAVYCTASSLCVPASWRRLHVSCQRLPARLPLPLSPNSRRMVLRTECVEICTECTIHPSLCSTYLTRFIP